MFGQLGDGLATSSSVQVAVSGGVFTAIVAGVGHTCGLGKNSGGRGWCWGYGIDGQIGDGIDLNANGPVAVSGNRIYSQIASGFDHSCALNDGGVWCWGANPFGQLGDGSLASHGKPAAIAPPD